MIYNEYKKTAGSIEFRVRYYTPSANECFLEIRSSKAAEQTFVKFNLNSEGVIIDFYGDSYAIAQHTRRARPEDFSPKNPVKINSTDFLKNPRYALHRQIYEEALQKFKEEIKK